MSLVPNPGEFYRHFKGKLYQVHGIAKHSETMEEMVVYQALYGTFGWYVRPLSMFMSEVDVKKYPEAKQRYRFEKVSLEQEQQPVETFDIPKEQVEINPDLLTFLEADGYRQKLEVLFSVKKRLDEQLLQTMAIAMDFTLSDGDFEDQYGSFVYFLETHAKFETNRLR